MRVDSIRQAVFALWVAVVVLLILTLLTVLISVLLEPYWILALGVAAVLLGLILTWLRRRVPRRTLLDIDFERGLVEQVPDDRVARLMLHRTMVLRDVIETLDRAAGDPRVVGLIARVGPNPLGLAHAQELHEAVERFRQAGKRAVACCETLGDGRSAAAGYLLASAFDEIHLQPVGDLGLNGLAVYQPFLRRLLDRLGVVPRLDHREQYKTASNVFTEQEMTPPHRESLTAILNSQAEQIVETIADSRQLDPATVRTLFDRGPFLASQALDAGLVNSLAYPDQIREGLERELRATSFELTAYLHRAGRSRTRGPRIALIHGVGAIARGRTRFRRFPPALTLGSDDVTAAFRAAARDRKVRAIVFRIDSPGGSAVASEAIWHAVQQAREAGKPVIASMSNVAGSGGYYIAAAADRVLAQPTTLTGSIGVVSGKLVTREAWQKLGVDWGRVTFGAHADLWSPLEDFSESGWQKLQNSLDEIYRVFKQRVAEGRNLSAEEVEEAARGRVWTGRMAQERRLVDELGGLGRAVEAAKEAAGISARSGVRLVDYPPRRRLPVPPLFSGGVDPASQLLLDAGPALSSLAPAFAVSGLDHSACLVMPLAVWRDPLLTQAASVPER